MKDLYRRLIASLIAVSIIFFLLLFSYHPILRYVVVFFIATLGMIAIWEYEQFVKAKGGQIISSALMVFTACQIVSFYISTVYPDLSMLPLAVFFLGFLTLFAMHFRSSDGAIVDLAVSSFGIIYIAIPLGMLLGILYFHSVKSSGLWWLIYVLMVTKISDMGAYFAGNLIGRKKLAPSISPKKTLEGAVFGLVSAIAMSFAFNWYGDRMGVMDLSGAKWIVLGGLLSAIGQFGDLAESLLKRDANKKDSNALPGLGGVLDSIDSILFNAVFVYIYRYLLSL
jgi:phosphatidate cytidylyltransferase